jgi:hypothetical protein
MNKRIKLLAKQADIDYDLRPEIARAPVWIGTDEELERFAQSIVAECGQLILDEKTGDLGDNPGVKEWEEGYNEAVHDCYYRIKQHFGVAE